MTGDERADVVKTKFQIMFAELPGRQLFGKAFLDIYSDAEWTSDAPNRKAAHQFRTTLISRIATARLPYGSGTEKRALESMVELFKKAREVTAENTGCGTFEILAWHALNAVVRPFTSKWHPLSEAGALDALDATDDFRAELYRVQGGLRELERALALLERETASYDPSKQIPFGDSEAEPPPAIWRPAGGVAQFEESERVAVVTRRKTYDVTTEKGSASGLALSGGGIRSATFSLGVLAALARRNLLPQFDYLSTVSGGGYTGCFLTSLLGRSDLPEHMGLRREQQPFKRTEEESEYLMGFRQRASFLSAGFLERLLLVMRSTYGVFVNVLLLFCVLALVAGCELVVRFGLAKYQIPSWPAWFFPLFAVFLLALVARQQRWQLTSLNSIHLALGSLFLLPLAWMALQWIHLALAPLTGLFSERPDLRGLSPILLVSATVIAVGGALLAVYARTRSIAAIAITIIFPVLIEHAFTVVLGGMEVPEVSLFLFVIVVFLGIVAFWVDVNETSLHRYYRSKLATAFIYEAEQGPPKLSEIDCSATLYPIINCALNAPGSEDPKMRGRLADVFSFTPHMTGSKIVEYRATSRWEHWNSQLDLASAMALSGAAVSPQMGLRTTRRGSFWLTLFNARLNAWLRNPRNIADNAVPPSECFFLRNGPGLDYLAQEFMGTATEKMDFANISDGGHIENLGVYELLKRRCRYIVAVDGESDPNMTFHALANLQRLAYIDMGIKIDADLDELRLQQTGFSRSHFRFCRIRYPTGKEDQPWQVGFLLYIKLSLTGNEGEFLRRYRLDEPMFPHHSTADQFFSETQFEAYRALGEHVGDKLFMKAIIEELADELPVNLEKWMLQYAKNFPAKTPVSQI